MKQKIIANKQYPNWFSEWLKTFKRWPFNNLNLRYVMPEEALNALKIRVEPQNRGNLYGTGYTYETRTIEITVNILNLVIDAILNGKLHELGQKHSVPKENIKILIMGPGKSADEINVFLEKLSGISNITVLDAQPLGPLYLDGKVVEQADRPPIDLVVSDILHLQGPNLPNFLKGNFDIVIDCHVFDTDYFSRQQISVINETMSRMGKPGALEISIFHQGYPRFSEDASILYTMDLAEAMGHTHPHWVHGGIIRVNP